MDLYESTIIARNGPPDAAAAAAAAAAEVASIATAGGGGEQGLMKEKRSDVVGTGKAVGIGGATVAGLWRGTETYAVYLMEGFSAVEG